MSEFLNGKKTYIAAAGMFLYGVLGVLLGQMSIDEAVKLVLGSAAVASVRHAIAHGADAQEAKSKGQGGGRGNA